MILPQVAGGLQTNRVLRLFNHSVATVDGSRVFYEAPWAEYRTLASQFMFLFALSLLILNEIVSYGTSQTSGKTQIITRASGGTARVKRAGGVSLYPPSIGWARARSLGDAERSFERVRVHGQASRENSPEKSTVHK